MSNIPVKDYTINGVDITVIHEDHTDVDLYTEKIVLGNGFYFRFAKGWDLKTLIQAAGHDPSKCDYAVPQSWFDRWGGQTGALGQAVWSYEGENNLMGHPITYEQMWLEIKSQLSLWV